MLKAMSLRVTGRDEMETTMHTMIGYGQFSVDLGLGDEKLLVLVVDVVDDGLPTVGVVDGLAETGRVDDGETERDALFGEQHGRGVDGGGLFAARERARKIGRIVELGEKERVHERRLAQTRLADHHQIELETLLDRLAIHLSNSKTTTTTTMAIESINQSK